LFLAGEKLMQRDNELSFYSPREGVTKVVVKHDDDDDDDDGDDSIEWQKVVQNQV
jgi:hypothetical protein